VTKPPVDLIAVRARWRSAQMAGTDSTDAGLGWDGEKLRAVFASWQDVPHLHDEVQRLRRALSAAKRGKR
jgi:hypothetical protein